MVFLVLLAIERFLWHKDHNQRMLKVQTANLWPTLRPMVP